MSIIATILQILLYFTVVFMAFCCGYKYGRFSANIDFIRMKLKDLLESLEEMKSTDKEDNGKPTT